MRTALVYLCSRGSSVVRVAGRKVMIQFGVILMGFAQTSGESNNRLSGEP